jgi:hypothetical protein
MISINLDNNEVYKLLEETGNLFTDFSVDKVILIDLEDDCYIVLYSESSRDFISFKAKNYIQDVDSLPSLLETVQDFSKPGVSVSLINLAVRLIENKIHSKNNARFYFDGH